MNFAENQLLFGHDPAERIVRVETDGAGAVTMFLREDDGATPTKREPLRPFLWADSEISFDGVETRRLEGRLALNFLAECRDWTVFSSLRTALRGSSVAHFALNDPVQQFLLQSGKTLFKGMKFADLKRLQIALECETVALSDATGWEETIEAKDVGRLITLINQRDPDVIEGHDLFRVILPALGVRARKARKKLALGRDGSPANSRASRIQVAEKTIAYPKFEIHGRHLVDTALLAQFYDVSTRELEGYDLDDVAQHFHIREDSAARQTRALAEVLSGSYFIQAGIFPYNYQEVVVRGNATKIDALLLREYYRQQHSIPDLPQASAFEGGYTDIFVTGVARNVWHCDVASLYPSVMVRFDCFPKQDQLGIFRRLLVELRKFRLEAKSRMREAPTSERAGLHALQSTFKILINSFYGYLGFSQAHFADFGAASRVTEIGRDLLTKMVAWLRDQHADVIEIDTDGIYFIPPPDRTEADLQKGLESVLPGGIEVEFDARYAAMFSYKAKNYALLQGDGEVIIKGGALKSRGLEKFQRAFMREMVRLLMEQKPQEVHALRRSFEERLRHREWPVEMFMKTDTLQDSLAQYQKKIGASARNRAAAYELALQSGEDYQPGDRVSFYITGSKKNVAAYENCRLASEWNPDARDENVEYYVAKLNDLADKFSEFIGEAPAKSDQFELL
jgi:DNA polymerase elongation subunit (family B)